MDIAVVEEASERFLGQWKRLVSTTNWEKGQIISEWRSALLEAGAAPAEYSDEVWSRQVGQVTPQHVGRLRRVFDRFATAVDNYPGLYWSHFQAALDWDDAEMWLEGAVHSSWSIADMRAQRAETLGLAGDSPAADLAEAELDEDAEPGDDPAVAGRPSVELVRPDAAAERRAAPAEEATDFADDDEDEAHARASNEEWDNVSEGPAAEPVRPFAHLASLPADVSDAFEAMKLAIVKHRLAGWVEIAQDDMLAALNALRALALAEADA
jgi:hypothetical protein